MQHDIFLYLWSTCSYRLYSFLGVRDAARLDTAFSNHAIRKQFHSCISRSSFVGLVYSRKSKEWIMSRNLAPDRLVLEHGITEYDIIKLGESCRGVEHLSARPTSESSPSAALSKILQHSPKLQVFMFNRNENVGTMVYRTIAEKCTNLTELIVQTDDVDIATMQAIFQSCRKLTKITLSDTRNNLQDSLVASIADHCLHLTSLALSSMGSISDEPIEKLTARCSLLTTLRLAYLFPTLHDELLELAAHCRKLTVLDLQLTVLNIAILATFAQNNPQLKRLGLANTRGVTDAALAHVTEHCLQLEGIDLTENSEITDWSVCELALRCPKLTIIVLSSVQQLTDVGVNAIANHSKELLSLDVSLCVGVTPAALCNVAAHCTKLESLSVTIRRTNDAVFEQLSLHCPNFVSLTTVDLDLGGEPIPATALLFVTSNYLSRLQHFCCITFDSISDAALLQVVENCPHLRTLEVDRLSIVCEDVHIVQTITNNCPQLHNLHFGKCSEQVTQAVLQWQQARSDRDGSKRVRILDPEWF